MRVKGSKGPPSIWIGQRFGRLTVLSNGQTRDKIKCLCDCGTTTLVLGANLRQGNTQSCKCLRRDRGAISTKVRPLC